MLSEMMIDLLQFLIKSRTIVNKNHAVKATLY